MFAGKPIIGIVGGIGSGKSFVARIFGEMGCLVIDSDQQVTAAYAEPDVRQTLRNWWGDVVIKPDGEVDRSLIASKVFSSPAERRRLEQLLHPRVNAAREALMQAAADEPQVLAFVWDTPLLLETNLNQKCDAVVFVDASDELRRERVRRTRGWDAAELARRENSQWPLDRKREIADYQLRSTADADDIRGQIREMLSRILATTQQRTSASGR